MEKLRVLDCFLGTNVTTLTTLYNVCSVHWGDTMNTLGDIMSASGDVQYIGGYNDACGVYSEYIGHAS